jgi:precorrin-6A/cobalt-precorrin-6A reductase
MPTSPRHRLLLLGGTGEALALAERLQGIAGIETISSLAGRTKNPVLPPGTVRVGGFGGIGGLVDYLTGNRISLLVNATHPYAADMSLNALRAHQATGVPLLRFIRPEWIRDPVDVWIKTPHVSAAADVCRWYGKRILLTIGSQEVAHFARIKTARFYLRLVDTPDAPVPLENYQLIEAKGPFNLNDERRLMLENGIDLIVSKNSGGEATYAKILAARELSIPVVMIDRPEIARRTGSDTAHTLDEAMDWIGAQLTQIEVRDRALEPLTMNSDKT